MGTGTGLRRFICPGQEQNRGKGVRGDRLHWRVQGSTSSPTGIGGGCFEVLWNLECPVGLSQREICAHFNEGNVVSFTKTKQINS